MFRIEVVAVGLFFAFAVLGGAVDIFLKKKVDVFTCGILGVAAWICSGWFLDIPDFGRLLLQRLADAMPPEGPDQFIHIGWIAVQMLATMLMCLLLGLVIRCFQKSNPKEQHAESQHAENGKSGNSDEV